MQRPKRKSNAAKAATQATAATNSTTELTALRKQLLEIIVRREMERKAKPK